MADVGPGIACLLSMTLSAFGVFLLIRVIRLRSAILHGGLIYLLMLGNIQSFAVFLWARSYVAVVSRRTLEYVLSGSLVLSFASLFACMLWMAMLIRKNGS